MNGSVRRIEVMKNETVDTIGSYVGSVVNEGVIAIVAYHGMRYICALVLVYLVTWMNVRLSNIVVFSP